MKNAKLRRRPRASVFIPAIIRLPDKTYYFCAIENLSDSGLGIRLAHKNHRKVLALKNAEVQIIWSPVPTVPAEVWHGVPLRFSKDSIGIRFVSQRSSSRQLSVLKRLVHFHLQS